MTYNRDEKEISKEDYEAIKKGRKNVYDFFSEAAIMGYGLLANGPVERDGKYFIPYYMSDSCD